MYGGRGTCASAARAAWENVNYLGTTGCYQYSVDVCVGDATCKWDACSGRYDSTSCESDSRCKYFTQPQCSCRYDGDAQQEAAQAATSREECEGLSQMASTTTSSPFTPESCYWSDYE